MPDTYDDAAAQQILALARARQGQDGFFKRSQLIDISRELGISPANFLAAEEEWLVHQEEREARSAFDQYRQNQLLKGLRRFGSGSALLLLSDLLATHQLSWSLYITLGWMIVLSLQAWQTYRAPEDQYNRAFRRWWLRQQIGESFKAISERLRSSAASSSADSGERIVLSGTSESADVSASRSLSSSES